MCLRMTAFLLTPSRTLHSCFCTLTQLVDWVRNSNYSYFPVFSPPDAPKPPSVSVSPSGEIKENISVTLTCSSDANPAATYVWYKRNSQPLSKNSQLIFSSIQSSDSGEYYCSAVNKLGSKRKSITIDVKCKSNNFHKNVCQYFYMFVYNIIFLLICLLHVYSQLLLHLSQVR